VSTNPAPAPKDVRAAAAPARRIVVGVDFSEPSLRALDHAIDLAVKLGASVVAVHAVDVPLYTFPDAATRRYADVDAPFLESAHAAMAAAIEPRRSRVAIEGHVRKGRAAEVIDAVAEEANAMYVVVAAHGHRGLDRILLGGTAQRIVAGSKRPVICVPAR
jgi:nucleotide-binding universal stress UspA family protein